MSKEKMINENDLKKVTGGSYIVWQWKHISCEKLVRPVSLKIEEHKDGSESFYCPRCKDYFPKDQWKALCKA